MSIKDLTKEEFQKIKENAKEQIKIDEENMKPEEITINEITYKLTPKIKLTDTEFIKHVLEKEKVDFNVGDTVWLKGSSVRQECGEAKFKVLSFEPMELASRKRVDSYLKVNLENLKSGSESPYLTTHLEKYNKQNEETNIKEITIDGTTYNLTPIQ